jgi:hypothetical protein
LSSRAEPRLAFAPASKEGRTVKRYALAAALALTLGGAAQAAAIDLVSASTAAPPAAIRGDVARFQSAMSELPEPEVFAMMLLGLLLIGYRARRDSSDKFK